MAEAGFTVDTGTAGAAAGAGDRPATRTSRPAEAKSVVDYAGLAACPSKLRQDGEQFVNNVVNEAEKYEMELKVTKIQGDNYEARVFSNGGLAYALIFHETFMRRDMSRIPSVSATKDVIRQLELKGITDQVVSVVVVTKEMYENYERVAASIVNTFRAKDAKTFKNLSITDFNASGELHVSMNLKEVIAFAEQVSGSPVGHADSGLLLYAKRRDPNKSGYLAGDDTTSTPILAVTGYTDLKRVAADPYRVQYKFDPTFVITGIYSLIRTDEMAMVGITLAADVFISRGMWLNAFSNFADGERNLGNLFINPQTKKPFSCKNIQERQALMTQHFTSQTPLLAIDLQEGCDQFPGLRDLIANPDRIKAELASFTGGDHTRTVDAIQGIARQYDGLVETAKGKIDTRAVDYMFLVDPKGGGVSAERAAGFLDYPDPNDPRAIEKKALLLEEFYNKIDLTYTTHRCFFNPDFVVGMATDLSSSINLILDSWINTQVYDISGLKRFAPNLGASYMAGGSVVNNGFRGYAY